MRLAGILAASMVLAAAAPASAAVVVERWGVAGHVQHPGTLSYDGRLMKFDLSALPAESRKNVGAKIHRARLVIPRGWGLYSGVFEVVPEGQPTGKPLALVGPHYRWFDATKAVRAALGGGTGVSFELRKAPQFARESAFLEVAYEGQLKDPPAQVSELSATYRSGQVWLNWKESQDLWGGNADLTWDAFLTKAGHTVDGPVPKDAEGELRFRVYRSDKPITAENIGRAQLLAEVAPGSGYNTNIGAERKGAGKVYRLSVEPGKPLPPGYGLYVHSVRSAGTGYYAVVAAANGLENTVEVGKGNTAGPVEEKVAEPEPLLERESVTDLKDAKFVQQSYSLWCDYPLAPRPLRYDIVASFCPEAMKKPAPLTLTRGHSWGNMPEPPGASKLMGVVIAPSSDWPNTFYTGINSAFNTLKGAEQGEWVPGELRRADVLIRWAQKTWPIDPQRIIAATGSGGMVELERAGTYSYIYGWGLAELTKGFQCMDRAKQTWGPPEAFAGRKSEDNPYLRADYSSYILADGRRELPYFMMIMGWGMHMTEMGWPPIPRMLSAMQTSKRAFVASWSQVSSWGWQQTPVHKAVWEGRIDVQRDQSLPAFGNCSLDDNPGDGTLASGDLEGQINGYLLWDTGAIVDEPGRWEMTIWVDASARRPECVVDLTPRRCQKFKAEPGQRFKWTVSLLGEAEAAPPRARAATTASAPAAPPPQPTVVQSGSSDADQSGLVTMLRLNLQRGTRYRVALQK